MGYDPGPFTSVLSKLADNKHVCLTIRPATHREDRISTPQAAPVGNTLSRDCGGHPWRDSSGVVQPVRAG